VKTIESYRENMKKKLELRDTVQLAQYAARTLDGAAL
jgi:DNA-binding NarL/FixJ family response regulator